MTPFSRKVLIRFSTAREDTPSFMAISAAVTFGFSLIAEMIAWFFSELFSEPEPFFSEPMALFSVVITNTIKSEHKYSDNR